MNNTKKSYETPEVIKVSPSTDAGPDSCEMKGETSTSPFDGCIFLE